jgi:hypothetical protein
MSAVLLLRTRLGPILAVAGMGSYAGILQANKGLRWLTGECRVISFCANVRNGSIASFERRRHVCFTANYGRITATQRTDALGQTATFDC